MDCVLWRRVCISMMVLLLLFLDCVECTVSYDHKAIVIDGQRRILISGSIHYPRSTPQMWEDLIQKAKDGGLDVIETYVFWNLHEPSPGTYDFQGRNDLVRFLKTIHKAGLYAHLRIGPYVCAEWNFGGFPVWLKYVPGISFRTDNEPFKRAMQGFTEKIVNLMKTESLYQHQGGPIILSQIENEYGVLSHKYGTAGKKYMQWAADMALKLGTGVPWVMCKEVDAPHPIINTCNGFYCHDFKPNSLDKPKMWTEAWTGWFYESGLPITQRPVQDLAYAVAKFFQKGGSLVNYYMYHGGTNFGRTAGGPFITTSYDYDAPIDEYGMLREPKSGHLRELHFAVKKCEEPLVASEPEVTELGNFQQAYIYRGLNRSCAFLSNNDDKAVKVLFDNMHYSLPARSISILLDSKHVIFNTAKVRVQTSQVEMIPTNKQFAWEAHSEDLTSVGDHTSAFPAFGLLEQISVTRDTTDYLWYTTTVNIDPSESFLKLGNKLTLNVQSTGHQLHVFVNGRDQGTASGKRQNPKLSYIEKVKLQAGWNTISLLSVAVGLPNIGPHFEQRATGINRVTLNGLDGGRRDLTWSTWNYQVGLKGESMNLAYPYAFSAVDWTQSSLQAQSSNQPLTWYRSYFDEPEGVEPLALDMVSMGKGQVWINGQSIGRYWPTVATGNCTPCSYVQNYRPTKCLTGCNHPTQRYYHLPRSFLRPTGNLVVVIEELGGDISRIRLVKKSVTSVCATVAENHPNYLKNMEIEKYGDDKNKKIRSAKLRLKCYGQNKITAIKFASFGTPQGKCGSLKQGLCHAPPSRYISEKNCIGKKTCSIAISTSKFGDPCADVLKRLSVEAVCSPSS